MPFRKKKYFLQIVGKGECWFLQFPTLENKSNATQKINLSVYEWFQTGQG